MPSCAARTCSKRHTTSTGKAAHPLPRPDPACRLMTEPGANCTKCKSPARLARWLQGYGPCRGVSSYACLINDFSSCLMDNRKILSTLKPFMALSQQTRGCWETVCCVFTWKWWNFIWHVQNDLHFLVLCIAVFCWTFWLYWTTWTVRSLPPACTCIK